MADLVMTEQERRIPIMDWDDESLGRAVKAAAAVLYEKDDPATMPGIGNLNVTACGVTLIGEAIAAGSDETTVVIRGASKRGVIIGDWEITIKRMDHIVDANK
jgi:hypothetical protein